MKLSEQNTALRVIKRIFSFVRNPFAYLEKFPTKYVLLGCVVVAGLPFAVAYFGWCGRLSADSYVVDGMMYQEMGLNERALELVDSAIKSDPGYAPAFYLRARTYAEWCFPSFIGEDGSTSFGPSSVVLHPAIDCEETADVPRMTRDSIAIDNLNTAVELDPGYADAYWYRAAMHKDSGDWDRAELDYRKACSLNDNYCSRVPKRPPK